MHLTKYSVTITTAATGGAGTGYVGPCNGEIKRIAYVKDDYSAGCDFVVTTEETAQAIWTGTAINATVALCPHQAVSGNTGTAATYDGTRPVLAPMVVANERIKIAVADGGVSKAGTFYIWVG